MALDVGVGVDVALAVLSVTPEGNLLLAFAVAFAVAVAVALAFLAVIPEGNLILPSSQKNNSPN